MGPRTHGRKVKTKRISNKQQIRQEAAPLTRVRTAWLPTLDFAVFPRMKKFSRDIKGPTSTHRDIFNLGRSF